MGEDTPEVVATRAVVVREDITKVEDTTMEDMVETKVDTNRTMAEERAEETEEVAVEATTKVDTSAMIKATETLMEEMAVAASETGAVNKASKTTLLPQTTTVLLRTTTWTDPKQLPLNVEEVQEVETSQEAVAGETKAVDLNVEVNPTITRTSPTRKTTTATLAATELDSAVDEVVLQMEVPRTHSTNKRMATRTNRATQMANQVLCMSAT
jgi:hypothetical protein